jgi:hypothetical protein
MYVPFEEMPANSRIWIYQADRPFAPDEVDWINVRLRSFCEGWNTHGQPMATSFDVMLNQVVILSVDEQSQHVSGCSIDSSVGVLREIENKLGLNLLDAGKIAVVSENAILVSALGSIRTNVNEGKIGPESRIIDVTVNKKADLRDRWIIPAKESWLKRYFR